MIFSSAEEREARALIDDSARLRNALDSNRSDLMKLQRLIETDFECIIEAIKKHAFLLREEPWKKIVRKPTETDSTFNDRVKQIIKTQLITLRSKLTKSKMTFEKLQKVTESLGDSRPSPAKEFWMTLASDFQRIAAGLHAVLTNIENLERKSGVQLFSALKAIFIDARVSLEFVQEERVAVNKLFIEKQRAIAAIVAAAARVA